MEETKHKQICIFGSSVNPPTRAHVAILKYFLGLKLFDEIWLVPVYKHMYSTKSNLTDFDQRVALCKASVIELEGVKVSTVEKEVYNFHYSSYSDSGVMPPLATINLLEFLLKKCPLTDFSLILGADAFVDLCQGKWHRGEELLRMVDLHVVQRDSSLSQQQLLDLAAGSRATCHFLASIPRNISSTRARSAKTKTELLHLVPLPVANMILDRSLFSFGKRAKY